MAVAVTGMGVVCAAGRGVDALWASAAAGSVKAELFDQSDCRTAVYRVHDPLITEAGGLSLARADRCVRLAAMAGMEAAASAALDAKPVEAERLGIVMGTSRGPLGTWDQAARRHASGKRQPPSLLVQGTLASLSGTLSVLFGARGMSLTVSAACASAAHAIALGAEQIESGAMDAVVVGGSDSPLEGALLEQFREAGLLGTHADPARAMRPFDRTRNGTVLGEGAAVLVLESLQSARRRGAMIRALLTGWGITSDASGRTAILDGGEGLRRAIGIACHRAGIEPRKVDYINAHGTGTEQNDLFESRSVAALVGKGALCSSTKPVTGHCAGATPAIEAILAIRALQEQFVPPTATCLEPDPACEIDPLPRMGRSASLRIALSNSLGLWGNNAALIFSRP